ncbi:MAG: hypothetical protein U0R49_05320 [Fimbriimonadales bacterium]
MSTYKEIDAEFRRRHGKSVKPCWIADVKELNGVPLRQSARSVTHATRLHPCPDRFRTRLETVMRDLGAIPSE